MPVCDRLEPRKLLSTSHHGAKLQASRASAQANQTSAFATDLQKLRGDEQVLIVDTQADTYDALALQADIQALKAEATATPSAAVETAFEAQLEASLNGFTSAAQTATFESAFQAFLEGEGITDKALIAKTISDQEALARTSEAPESATIQVILDRRALANDLGFGAGNLSAITSAGPSASALKAASELTPKR